LPAGSIEVSEYTVNNLFKKRAEIVRLEQEPAQTVPAAPAAPQAAVPAAKPQLPAAPPSLTTPPLPLPLPAAPKTEIQTAADPAAPKN
jgi:hypothetical protein